MAKTKKAQTADIAVITVIIIELASLGWTFATFGTSWELGVCVAIFTIVNIYCACYEPPAPPAPPAKTPQHWTGPFTQPDRERVFLDLSEETIFANYLDQERETTRRLLGQGDGVA